MNAVPYPDEQSMVKDIKNGVTVSCLGGIFFDNLDFNSNITYKIRLPATLRMSGAGYEIQNYFRSTIGSPYLF